MNRHQLREKLMICIYQSQLLKKALSETVEDNFESVSDIEDYGKNLIKSLSFVAISNLGQCRCLQSFVR